MNRKFLPFIMWVLPLSFFTYQFILRLWPSLMIQQIMNQFQIDATRFGLLASFYYYGYAAMQLPIAILLDRYNPRYIICVCAILCGVSTLLFTFTTDWHVALLSRFLIGIGSAGGFLSTSKIVSQWFPRVHYARMIGFSFTIGLLGAVYGGKPTNLLIENFGWKNVATGLAVVSVIIGLFNYLFLKQNNSEMPISSQNAIHVRDFTNLLKMPSIWLLAIANLLMVGPLEGFADVWGVNYLMAANGISKSDAASIISFIFIGMLFGGPLLAELAKYFGNYLVIIICSIGMVLIFQYLLFDIANFNKYMLFLLFTILGILCCYQVIVFASGSELVTPLMLGVTIALLNCINMLGGSFFHSTIGWAMDFFWLGETHEGIRHYTDVTYQNALLIIPISAAIGGLLIIFLKMALKKRWIK